LAKIKVQVTTPGAKAAADALLKLSAAERKVALEAAGMSRAMKKTGRAGKAASSSMLAGFSKVGGALVGIGSAAAAIAGSVRLIRTEFERLKAVDTGAFTAQATLGNVVGKFIVNNPQTSAADVSSLRAMMREAGEPLGAGGGALAMSALMALRGQTPGASSEDQIAAIRVAAKLKAIDPDIDMASFSANAIKLQESARRGGQELTTDQAFKTMLFTGSRAGGDISELSGAMIRLTGAEGLATGNDLQELLSLFAFGTAETGDVTGKPTASTVSTLLTRMMTRPLKVDGQEIEMVGDTGLDKLLNMVERIRAGEFEEPHKIIKALGEGGGDVMAVGLIQQLVAKLDRFLVTKEAITRTRTDTDIGAELQRIFTIVMPEMAAELERKRAAAKLTAAEEDMSREGVRARKMEEVESLRKAHKIETFEGQFLGGLGFAHKLRTIQDVRQDRSGEEILEFGTGKVADLLARRLLGGETALELGIHQFSGRVGQSKGERERFKTIRAEIIEAAATGKIEALFEVMARRNLITAEGGISLAEKQALLLQGHTEEAIAALKLENIGRDGQDNLKTALTALTDAVIAATRDDNFLPEITRGRRLENIPIVDPEKEPPVPIDANDL
tara:strand:- start:10839 stop:12689 length:1851 start_codon:yes stop_codon:yes gene_type:complete